MSLGGRKRKPGGPPPKRKHGPRCPLRPENLERHTPLDRRFLSCTCAWDERG